MDATSDERADGVEKRKAVASVRIYIIPEVGSEGARLKSVRSTASRMWWDGCCGGRAKTWDALGRSNMRSEQKESAVMGYEGEVIVRFLPTAAYRLLMEFLKLDKTFCECVVPLFIAGDVMLYVIVKKQEGASASRKSRHRRVWEAVDDRVRMCDEEMYASGVGMGGEQMDDAKSKKQTGIADKWT